MESTTCKIAHGCTYVVEGALSSHFPRLRAVRDEKRHGLSSTVSKYVGGSIDSECFT